VLAELGVSYVGTVFTSPGSWQSGVGLSARYVTRFGGYASAAYDVFAPGRIQSESVVLALGHHPGAVAAGYARSLGTHLRVEGELAFIVDVVTRSTEGGPTGFKGTPDATRAAVALGPRARIAWRPVGRVWLSAGGGVDVVVNDFSYVVSTGNPIVTVPIVRPRLDLGIALDLP
jgi:hypothetical protein